MKKTKTPDLLTAVLSLFESLMPPSTQRKARLAALEVAVLVSGDSLDVACEAIKCRMQELKYKGITTATLKKEAKAIQDQLLASNSVTRESTTVKSIHADAPVSDSLVIPRKWKMTAGEIRQRGDCERVELVWKRGEGWQHETVERKVIANKNAIVDLASRVLLVHSGNATLLVKYLHDFLVENESRLPVANASGRMGW